MNSNEEAFENVSSGAAPPVAEQKKTKRDKSSIAAIDSKIALILIETPAITDQALAEKLGISRQTANRRKNNPAVQKLIRDALSLPQKEVRRITAKALARLEAMLDDPDPKIKLAATIALVKLNPKLMSGELIFW